MTSFEAEPATARSSSPSRSKSPAAIPEGEAPADERIWGENVPSPLPRRTDTSFEPWFATARSCLKSPLKSPTAIATGPAPTP